jgi:probable HAF family extracellular repeat protein
MKTSKNNFRFFATSLGIAAPLWILSAASAQTYNVTNLGNLGGASYADGINNAGQIVGYSFLANGTYHAFEYQGGVMTDLSPIIGGTNSAANAINASGQIVGLSYSPTMTDPIGYSDMTSFIDTGGSVTTIAPLPGGYTGSFATAINSSGQVAGEAFTYNGPYNGIDPYEAYLYSPGGGGTLTDLGNLGVGNSSAAGINDSGQVVGNSYTTDNSDRAFLYSGSGPMVDLGQIGGPGGTSYAYAINNAGLITGQASGGIGGNSDAFLYSGSGPMTDLGNLGGSSEGWAINNAGVVVGDSYLADGITDDAFIYSNGTMTDLNSLIPADSGWQLEAAYGINDNGDIVGYGLYDGQTEAFELTAVPEPASAGLLLVGGAAALMRRRRRRLA